MACPIESLASVTARNLKSYGEEVVLQRAVPDFRDGLKPVHRCVLWALYGLGLRYNVPFKKAARTVGEVIGKYHPHGDTSVYDAMVGIAGTKNDKGNWATRNSPVPLVEGFGNWGDNVDPAAAYRYTEARLSEFSCRNMLDPVYLAVTEYLPNFSGDDKVPLVLPSKLPALLMNGSVSIAFAISAECPSFHPKGILELVSRYLNGEKLSHTSCLKSLVFNFAFGGKCISDNATKLSFFKTGKGSLHFRPDIEVVAAKRLVAITSAAPGLVSKTSWSTLSKKLLSYPEIASTLDSTDRSGFRFEVHCAKGIKPETVKAIVEKETTKLQAYDIGVTHRKLDGVTFRRSTVLDILQDWCDWRIDLEVKVINHLIKLELKKLARQNLILLAVLNLETVIDSLRAKDSVAFLVKKLKITEEEANEILDLKVRQLKALEEGKLRKAIKDTETEIRKLKTELKKPEARILKDLSTLDVASF